MKSFRLISWITLFLVFCVRLDAAPEARARPDRVYGIDKIVDACTQAERENLPLCFCLLEQGVPGDPKAVFPGMATAWKEAMDRLSGECLVIEVKEPEPKWTNFAGLILRSQSAKPRFSFTGITLVDPWQETMLGSALIDPGDWVDADKQKGTLPKFQADMRKLLKAAADWKAAHRPKPENWTDTKGRSLVAIAQSWDGKTAVLLLQNGKPVSLPAATLSAESLKRLDILFPAPLPIVNASDAAALEAHVGQKVCVVGREASVSVFGESRAFKPGVFTRLFYLSRFFAVKYDAAMEQKFGVSHPGGGWPCLRLRASGVLKKEEGTGFAAKDYKYFIEITEPRQLGPGPMPD